MIAERCSLPIRRCVPSKAECLLRYSESPYFLALMELFILLDRLLPQDWHAYIHPTMNGREYDLLFLHEKGGAAIFILCEDKDPFDQEYNQLPSFFLSEASGSCTESMFFFVLCKDFDENTAPFAYRNHPSSVTFIDQNQFLSSLYESVSTLIFPKELDVFRHDHSGAKETFRAFKLLLETSTEDDYLGHLPGLHELTKEQKAIIHRPTEHGQSVYWRVRGSAGSGKSVVLAARAAKLLLAGKDVLILCFNITLTALLQRLVNRYLLLLDPIKRAPGTKSHLEIKYFHAFVLDELHQYCKIRDFPSDKEKRAHFLQVTLPEMLQSKNIEKRYDSILVDEGQDFYEVWWELLKRFLKPNGEMILFADKTQNLYNVQPWYDIKGFRENWQELPSSYRMPRALTRQAAIFAETYLNSVDRTLLPDPPQGEMFDSCHLRWIQVYCDPKNISGYADVVVNEILKLRKQTTEGITFLTPFTAWGNAIVHELRNRGYHPIETFGTGFSELHPSADSYELSNLLKQQKTTFQFSEFDIRGTTIKSYKGADSSALVVCINGVPGNDLATEFYVALTRLSQSLHGTAFLTVVCSDKRYETFGRGWDDIKNQDNVSGEFIVAVK